MHDMNEVSARELQREIKAVLDRVERGESVEITRRGRRIARLVPADEPVPAWPDLANRAAAVMGSRLVVPAPSEQVVEDRGER
jgi:prevent-host-death family protein